MIIDSVLEHVGNTPMVRADRLAKAYGLKCNLYCKCEYFNAGGSVKDRIAKRMVAQAEKDGKLIRGKSTIIEPTSGNTGIGLALQAAVLGYRCIICLPEKMSKEKVTTLQALGAEVIRTPNDAGPDDPRGHIQLAQRLAKEIPYGIVLDQYANLANPEAHYYGTGAEIAEDIKATSTNAKVATKLDKLVENCSITNGLPTTHLNGTNGYTNGHSHTNGNTNGMNGMSNGQHVTSESTTPVPEEAREERLSSGQVDLLVAGAGTGGSISGISKRLKEEWPGEEGTRVLGVDPVGSLLALPASLNELKEGESSFYAVEGIGYDFVPKVLDRDLVDVWAKVNDERAFAMARKLIRTEGLLVGGSCGCAMAGAIEYLTQTEEGKKIGQTPGKNVVVIMPDSIRNYISKPWLLEPQAGDEAHLAH